MTDKQIDEISQRVDRLDSKITGQIERLHHDIGVWIHGSQDSAIPGINVRLDRLERINSEARRKENVCVAFFCSIISGALAWIATMAGIGQK